MKSYATSTCVSASFLLFLKLAEGGESNLPRDTGATSQYLFTQQVSVDPVEDSVNLSSETESLAFYSDYDEHATDDSSSPSVVSSSLLFGDEECLFSLSEALTCNGGDMFAQETTTLPFFDSDYEQDSDDEDDNDATTTATHLCCRMPHFVILESPRAGRYLQTSLHRQVSKHKSQPHQYQYLVQAKISLHSQEEIRLYQFGEELWRRHHPA